LADIYIWH